MALPKFMDYTTNKNQNIGHYTKNWDSYNPDNYGGFYDPNKANKYSGAESTMIDRLTGMVKHGGYTPEQKKAMYQGSMQNVYREADQARERVQNDAYARGLGQSSVLSRGYGDIDQAVLAESARVSGELERDSAQMGMEAMTKIQQGEQIAQQYAMEANQFKQNLMAQLNMNEGQLNMALNQINSAIDMDTANREMQFTQIMNDFNLNRAELEIMQVQAEKDRKASFWSNLIGGTIGAGGNILGSMLGKPTTNNYYNN